MQNTGTPNTPEVPFVKQFEMSIMQYVILNKAQQGEVTKDNLKNVFKGNLQMSGDHFDHCVRTLVTGGHLKENNNKYSITDDGREDVQKVQHFIPELQQFAGGSAGGNTQQNRPTQTQQATSGTGGRTGTGGPSGSQSGNVGSGTQNKGNVSGQQNPGQQKGTTTPPNMQSNQDRENKGY